MNNEPPIENIPRRNLEEWFDLAVQAAEIGVWDWDIRLNQALCSEGYFPLFGIDPRDHPVSYERWLATVHPEDREKVTADVQRTLNTHTPYESEYRIVHPDGSVRWVRGNGKLFLDDLGKPERLLGSSILITRLKETERALQNQKTLLESQIEASPDGILVVGEDGQWLFWNKRFIDLWRIPEHIQNAPSPHIRMAWLAQQVKEPEKVVDRIWYFYNHPDETGMDEIHLKDNRIIDQYSAPVRRPDGSHCGRIWHCRDTTALRRMTEQLRHAQKMEATGRLSSGVAHDFNNLLTVITGYGDILAQHPDMPEHLRTMIEEMMSVASRSSMLVRQLLTFSRQQPGQPGVIELNQLTGNTGVFLNRLVQENTRIRIETADTPCHIFADASQIENTLVNLVINARDAMPEGGDIIVSVEPCLFDASMIIGDITLPSGDYIKWSVRDTGVGMDETTRERIFEPFFTTKPADRGTGLGMSTVYGIVRESRGGIAVESAPGQGTTVTIFFPVYSETDEKKMVAPSSGQNRFQGTETVLVVEDEPTIRILIRQVLRSGGYNVIEAASSTEAINRLTEYNAIVHLLVTDVGLPDMSGPSLHERLRQDQPRMKVIFVTGYPEEELSRYGVIEAKDTVIQKPFSALTLSQTVREALDQVFG